MTARPSTAAPILAVLAIGLVALGAYVGGYFWLGEYTWFQSPGRALTIERAYSFQWQTILFSPAAKIESLLSGRDVRLRYQSDGGGGVI
jgi:hypothetical protein